MRVVIDLTDAATYPGGDEFPDPSMLSDDGDAVLRLGKVEVRMTDLQFDRLLTLPAPEEG